MRRRKTPNDESQHITKLADEPRVDATATAAWWATASEHQSEMLDFMSHRLSKDSDAVRELGQCRSWEDASGVHSRWLQDTFTDYSAEGTKVMAINVKSKPLTSPRTDGRVTSKFIDISQVCVRWCGRRESNPHVQSDNGF